MTFIDTHVAVWLYADKALVPDDVLAFLDAEDLLLSPMAALEIEYLREIGRIAVDSRSILASLAETVGLRLEERHLARALLAARDLKWTRDPFDRIIVAHAEVMGIPLVTRDGIVREHCRLARWSGGASAERFRAIPARAQTTTKA
jgi:PIN domain nuclease of toxin-antitoxin system